MSRPMVTLDGNEATAYVAHKLSEVIAIYPITPSSPMGEFADEWSALKRPNLWGTIPTVIEMQSEGGAAGAVHGALQAGALTTTFTASQGLLLMIPNMYKIAGELTSTVFPCIRPGAGCPGIYQYSGINRTSWRPALPALLCWLPARSRKTQDMALIAHSSTLEARIPFLHFFDGFRTSHEVNKIERVYG